MPGVSVPTEHSEQVTLMEWAALNLRRYPDLAWLAAIPNGGDRHPAVAAKLKAEGVKRGYPDLTLDVARGAFHGLRIEMKRRRGGALSADQRAWGERLLAQGYAWQLCAGWEAARDALLSYLALPTVRAA